MIKDQKTSIVKILNVVFTVGILIAFLYFGILFYWTMQNDWQIPGYSADQSTFMDFLEVTGVYTQFIIPLFALMYSIFYSIRRFLLKITQYSLIEQLVVYGPWLYWLLLIIFLQTFIFAGKH